MNEQVMLQVVGKLSMEKEVLLAELHKAHEMLKDMQAKMLACKCGEAKPTGEVAEVIPVTPRGGRAKKVR
jgi:hypothetical protein